MDNVLYVNRLFNTFNYYMLIYCNVHYNLYTMRAKYQINVFFFIFNTSLHLNGQVMK